MNVHSEVEMTWTAADIPDQHGRTAVVTGANGGLGLVTARDLAAKGAHVVMAVRNQKKAAAAVEKIGAAVPDAALELVALDLSSQASVKEAAGQILAAHEGLDLLVNNAGVMMTPYLGTKDGFELQLGINHLGPFAFTGLLLDRLLAAPAARIVTVSSLVHRRGIINFNDLSSALHYDRTAAYGRSKLANLLFAYELQRRLAASGATAMSLAAHPGYARTGLTQHMPPLMQAGSRLAGPIIGQSAAMGALPILRAATDPAAVGGSYYGPGGLFEMKGSPRLVRSNKISYDEGIAGRLWSESEQLTGVTYPLLSSSAPGR
jgi:NAD(P)-dependent dehydrogenase (short-subunit alcohol dehydrogenase family)